MAKFTIIAKFSKLAKFFKTAKELGGKGVFLLWKRRQSWAAKAYILLWLAKELGDKSAGLQKCWAAKKMVGKRVLDQNYDQSYTRVIPELRIHQS